MINSFYELPLFQIEEEKRSELSMLEMHKTWRNIMRQQSLVELKRDIGWLSQKHVHEVNFLS